MTLKKHCLSFFDKWFKYMLICIALVFLGIGVATICVSADSLVAANPLSKVFESTSSLNANALKKTSKLASSGDSTDTDARFDGNATGKSTLYTVQTNFDKKSGPTGTKYFSGAQAVAIRVTLNSALTSTNNSITISLGKLVDLSDVSNISFLSLKSEGTNSKDYFTYSVDTSKGTLTVTPTAAGLAAGLGAGSGAFDIYLTTSATSDQKTPGTYPISVTNDQTNIIDTSVQVYNPVVNNGKILPTQIFGNNGGTPMPYMYPGTNDQRNFDMNCVAQMAVKNPDGSAASADQANDLAYRYTQNYMVAYASIVIKNVTPTQITWKMNVSLPNKATPSGGDDPTIYEPDKLRIMYKPADSNDFSEFTNAVIKKASSDNKNVEYTISDIKQKFQPGDELVVPMAITTSGSEKYARLTSSVTATGDYEGSPTTTDSTQIRNLYYIDQVPGKFVPIVDGYENVMSQAAIANTYPEDNSSITALEPSSTVNLGNNTPFKDADNGDADVPGFSLAAVKFAAAYDNNLIDGKSAAYYANSQTTKNITSELIEESSFMQSLTAGTTRKFHVTATNMAGSNKNLATLHVLPNLKINFVDSAGNSISDVKPMELQGGKSVSSNLTNFSKAKTPVIGKSDDGDANSYYFVANDNKGSDQGISKNSDLTGLINSHIQTDTGTTDSDQKYTIESNPFDSTTAINWQDVYNALSADKVTNNVNPDSTEPYVKVALKSNATPSKTVNGTAKFVADDTAKTQLHDDVTFKGTVGKAYDLSGDTNIQAAIKAVEDKGYTLKTTPEDPMIDADASKDVVTYVFTKNADTTVNGTAKFVADDTAKTQLHDDVTFKGTVGKAYDLSGDTNIQAAIKAVEDKGYTLKTTPANPKIDVDTSKDVVTYVFSLNSTPTPTPGPNPEPTPTPNPTPITPTPTPVTPTPEPSTPSEPIAKKGEAVYSLKKIYLYKNNTFSKNERRAGYSRKPRVYRPMFVVTGYSHSKNGRLRYQVRDVNHLTKNKGKKGYITAQWAYVRPVYYQSSHKTLTVINPRGVNAYTNVSLTGKVRNYKQGTVLHVTKFVKHNLTTRYLLSNGQYVTGNRKLVEMGKHKQVRYVKVKKTINRYKTVNLTGKNKHIKKGTKIKVQRYDFSHANSVNNVGALRYKVAGGYITGNSKFVKAYY